MDNPLLQEYKQVVSIIIFMLILPLSTISKAEVFQWKDAQGQIHFGDRPPNINNAKNISEKLENINVSTDFSSPELLLKYERQKEVKQHKKRQQRQDKINQLPSRAEACAKALKAQKILNGRVYFLDEYGKEVKVSEKERQKRADKLATSIKKHCS